MPSMWRQDKVVFLWRYVQHVSLCMCLCKSVCLMCTCVCVCVRACVSECVRVALADRCCISRVLIKGISASQCSDKSVPAGEVACWDLPLRFCLCVYLSFTQFLHSALPCLSFHPLPPSLPPSLPDPHPVTRRLVEHLLPAPVAETRSPACAGIKLLWMGPSARL